MKNEAGRRGARFIGTKASAEFDFYTGQLRVDYYNGKHTAVHQFRYPEGLVHFGGDEELERNLWQCLEERKARQIWKNTGLASAAACLAAKRAAGRRSRMKRLHMVFEKKVIPEYAGMTLLRAKEHTFRDKVGILGIVVEMSGFYNYIPRKIFSKGVYRWKRRKKKEISGLLGKFYCQ